MTKSLFEPGDLLILGRRLADRAADRIGGAVEESMAKVRDYLNEQLMEDAVETLQDGMIHHTGTRPDRIPKPDAAPIPSPEDASWAWDQAVKEATWPMKIVEPEDFMAMPIASIPCTVNACVLNRNHPNDHINALGQHFALESDLPDYESRIAALDDRIMILNEEIRVQAEHTRLTREALNRAELALGIEKAARQADNDAADKTIKKLRKELRRVLAVQERLVQPTPQPR